MFTHCYAHKLNLVLMHSAKCMPESRTFSITVEGLGTFFSKSTKRTHLLDDVVKRRLLRAAPTQWSSNSRMLQTIRMFLLDLSAVFRIISENSDKGKELFFLITLIGKLYKHLLKYQNLKFKK